MNYFAQNLYSHFQKRREENKDIIKQIIKQNQPPPS